MKTLKRVAQVLLVVVALFSILGCNLTGCLSKGAEEAPDVGVAGYNQMIEAVQYVQREQANFWLAVDTSYGKIETTNVQAMNYYTAVEANTESWTGHFREEEQAVVEMLQKYAEAAGEGDPSQLNLAELQQEGLMPSDVGNGFALLINAVQQAPPPVVDSAVTMMLMDTTSEAYEVIRSAGMDWNEAVRHYNTMRSTASGELVAAVSETVGFPLPEELQGYESPRQIEGGSIGAPDVGD